LLLHQLSPFMVTWVASSSIVTLHEWLPHQSFQVDVLFPSSQAEVIIAGYEMNPLVLCMHTHRMSWWWNKSIIQLDNHLMNPLVLCMRTDRMSWWWNKTIIQLDNHFLKNGSRGNSHIIEDSFSFFLLITLRSCINYTARCFLFQSFFIKFPMFTSRNIFTTI